MNARSSAITGGEFVLTEQRPRMQSRAEVVPLRQGDAVAFAVHNRPVQGSKGNLANFHRWRKAQSSIRIQEGEPSWGRRLTGQDTILSRS
jgi:hypothetical protein